MKRLPLKRISSKRAIALKEYMAKRERFLGYFFLCQCEDLGCANRATEIHHVHGRIGTLLNDTTQWMAVCRTCHTWIHNHPKQAREIGYLK